MLKAGRYDAKILSAELTEASTGTPQVAIALEVENSEEFSGELITWFGFLSEKAFPFTLKALRAIGFIGSDITAIETQKLMPASIVVEMDEWEGQERPKVKWLNARGSGPNLTPMSNKADFAKAMALKIAALEAGSKPAKTIDEALDGDDVPFDL